MHILKGTLVLVLCITGLSSALAAPKTSPTKRVVKRSHPSSKVKQKPQPKAQPQPEMIPAKGELRLDGRISEPGLENGSFRLLASSLVTSNGKSKALKPSRDKVVDLSDTTRIFKRGAPERLLTRENLRTGVR